MRTSFGFRFSEDISERLYAMESIGWGEALDVNYRQDGMKRLGSGHLFQYTLSGAGSVTVGGVTYDVPKNCGFFVTIPGDHQYFYPPGANKQWEFIWIRAMGGQMSRFWQHFIRSFGPVATFRPDSEPIRLMWKLYEDVRQQRLRDKYQMSCRLYEWILSIERMAEGKHDMSRPLPESLRNAKESMERQLERPVSLDEAAAAAGMSKHHFCKIFKAYTGVTPMHYVRKLRVEEAARLLRSSDLSVEDIARKTGFDNVSYFGKVFRQFVGATPTEYRKGGQASLHSRHLQIVE